MVQTFPESIFSQNGCVKEKGTHEDLMELRGLYFSLVERQTTGEDGAKGAKKQKDKKQDKESDQDAAKTKVVEKEDETKLTQSRLKLYGRLLALNK